MRWGGRGGVQLPFSWRLWPRGENFAELSWTQQASKVTLTFIWTTSKKEKQWVRESWEHEGESPAPSSNASVITERTTSRYERHVRVTAGWMWERQRDLAVSHARAETHLHTPANSPSLSLLLLSRLTRLEWVQMCDPQTFLLWSPY